MDHESERDLATAVRQFMLDARANFQRELEEKTTELRRLDRHFEGLKEEYKRLSPNGLLPSQSRGGEDEGEEEEEVGREAAAHLLNGELSIEQLQTMPLQPLMQRYKSAIVDYAAESTRLDGLMQSRRKEIGEFDAKLRGLRGRVKCYTRMVHSGISLPEVQQYVDDKTKEAERLREVNVEAGDSSSIQ